MRTWRRGWMTFVVMGVMFCLALPINASVQPLQQNINGQLRSLEVPFIENQGQKHPDVAFYASTFVGNVWVTRSGAMAIGIAGGQRPDANCALITETLVGALPHAPSGKDRSRAIINTFLGNDPKQWRKGIQSYDRVSMGAVYPGIELSLRAYANNVEKIFTIAPGADPNRIVLAVTGTDAISINDGGELVFAAAPNAITMTPPVAYQEINGQRRSVDVAYTVDGTRSGFRQRYIPRRRIAVGR